MHVEIELPDFETLHALRDESDKPEDVGVRAALQGAGHGELLSVTTIVEFGLNVTGSILATWLFRFFQKRGATTILINKKTIDLSEEKLRVVIEEVIGPATASDQARNEDADYPRAESGNKGNFDSRPTGEKLGWREHRRIVEDVSDSLSKSWGFKIQVCTIVILVSAAVISLLTLLVGGRIIDTQVALAEQRLADRITGLSANVDAKLKKVDQQVDAVGIRVEARINKEFEAEQIRDTVRKVASTAAAKVIAEQIQPAEKTVGERLKSFEKFLDDRKAEYDANQEIFRKELEVLKKRNELTRLADEAIGNRSLKAFQRLSDLLADEADQDVKNAEVSEQYRVVQAYSIFAPSRAMAAKFNVSAINPLKTEESDLSTEELAALLRASGGIERARAAILLAKKPITLQIAEVVAVALEKETDLEALRYEKDLFSRLPGTSDINKDIDATAEVKWFKENAERLGKELPPK